MITILYNTIVTTTSIGPDLLTAEICRTNDKGTSEVADWSSEIIR